MQNPDYGFEVRHSGGGGHGFENEQQQPQLDYNDDNRDVNANFYDNKYYDNFKLHRWVWISKLERRFSQIEFDIAN